MYSKANLLLLFLALLCISPLAFSQPEDNYQPIFVDYFQSESKSLKEFLPDITNTFESVLINTGCCKTVSRRKLNRLMIQRKNEKFVLSKTEDLKMLGAKAFILGEVLDQTNVGQVKLIASLVNLNGEKISSEIVKMDKRDFYSSKKDSKIAELAQKLSKSIQRKTSKDHVRNDLFSAKEIADLEFKTGKYVDKYWWSLVCQSVDIAYDREISKLFPSKAGKPALTKEEKKIWNRIFNNAVDEIHKDMKDKFGKKAMPESKIRKKILKAECKPRK